MQRAVEHLTSHRSGGLALDPGLGKTSITLEAFRLLQQSGQARTMLVIAPLRVCRMVWRQEGAKWDQFRHLRFSLLHGAKKAERLKDDADIWLVNPEGIAWLCKLFFGRPLPFDVVCIDELTKFKNAQSDRSKALRPRLAKTPWRWGLTGSLAPNGYMDVFGQMLVLDDGAALGRYITHYRDQYFQLGYNGFDYTLLPGAEQRIIARIAPYWLQMSADDYLQLPELVQDDRHIAMSAEARKTYEEMKKDMLAELPEGTVTAANAAAVYSKLAQMANGAVYVGSSKQVAKVHNDKLDALEELVDELNGEPLLVAYEFQHDLARLRERFGDDLPYLGNGTTPKQEAEWIAAWNRGEIKLFACHPASAGHGLNLQEGNAGHICWWSRTWDLELYDQFIRRVRRSGNTRQRIVNHILTMTGTIDELKAEALRDKDTTQVRLLQSLNSEIRRTGADNPTDRAGASDKETKMVVKLTRQQPVEAAPTGTGAIRGWGNPAGAAQSDGLRAQQERIAERLNPVAQAAQEAAPDLRSAAQAAFSGSVQNQMRVLGAEPVAPPPFEPSVPVETVAPRARRASKPTEAPAPDNSLLMQLRAEALKVAFADPEMALDDGLEIARKLMEFVQEG